MPLIYTDCVIDQEDKTFDSSVGNWTGDATWQEGSPLGQAGMAVFSSTGIGDPKYMTLRYHNFDLFQGCQHLPFWLQKELDTDWFYQIYTCISDGNYIIENTENPANIPNLEGFGLTPTLPTDWNKTNTFVRFGIIPTYLAPIKVAIKSFQMYAWVPDDWEPPTTRTDYLPIMGIG
jgi:hypothetical protein